MTDRVVKLETDTTPPGATQKRRPTSSAASGKRPSLKPRVPVNRDEAISRNELADVLGGLALHDRSRSDLTADQWAERIKDYLDALDGYPAYQIDLGVQAWIRGKSPFFPSIGEFIQAMEDGHRQWMAN